MNRIAPITVPKWGIEMQEGTITAWHAEPGQRLAKGDPLLDVETEKIVNSVEAPIGGVLRRILAEPGETRAVGTLIGVFAEPEVPDSEIDSFVGSYVAPDTSFEYGAATQAAPSAPVAAEPSTASADDGEQRVSPIARRLAEKLGVDLSKVKGTGRNGRISKEDVEAAHAALQAGAEKGTVPFSAPADRAAVAPAGTGQEPTREPMSAMRLTIARRLVESKQTIPHYRVSVDVDMRALLGRRETAKASGAAISVNDLLIKACALALVRHPQVNAQIDGQNLLKFAHADIAVAVATAAGLVTPIVRSADTLSLAEISARTLDLIERAQSGGLSREEISGGTFTLSNLGMFGVDRFDAIINPPQVAILAVGAARDAAVVRNGAVQAGRVATLTFAFDHRVVDGAEGARFAAAVRELIEQPASL
ncbi:MAG TPA: dihydrolipoamide acetyltransferase family protein [Steroidobacteraceae bacterium]|nr:dihydrolipoamide acetyltransferase family protein [Steroidobacteraceae bacterium]